MAIPRVLIEPVDDEGELFALNIDDMDCCKSFFERAGVKPSGHSWEAATIAYCERSEIDLSGVEFDSESDMFVAYASDNESLVRLGRSICALAADPTEFVAILSELPPTDNLDFSVEEFVETLQYNDIDVTKPLRLAFYVEFPERESVFELCRRASADGYDCLVQVRCQPYFFAGEVVDTPTVDALRLRIDYFEDLAEKMGGRFVDCSDTDAMGSPLEDFASDWERFTSA